MEATLRTDRASQTADLRTVDLRGAGEPVTPEEWRQVKIDNLICDLFNSCDGILALSRTGERVNERDIELMETAFTGLSRAIKNLRKANVQSV